MLARYTEALLADRAALGTGMVPDPAAATMGRYDRLDERAAEDPQQHARRVSGRRPLPHCEVFAPFLKAVTDFLPAPSE